MAIRNLNGINNAADGCKSEKELAVKKVQNELMFYNDYILGLSKDIIDVIDTFNYCCKKNIKNIVNKYSKTYKTIGVTDNKLFFQHNDWQAENGGPYNWYVYTDGKKVFVQVNDTSSDVPTMAKKTLYKEEKVRADRVIAPIVNDKGWYTCHNSEKPLRALKDFADKIKPFIAGFFSDIDNMG